MLEKGTKVRVTYKPTVMAEDGTQVDFWGYVEAVLEDGYILAAPFQKIDSVRYCYSPGQMSLITVAAGEVVAY